eukprot:CAMPEP_0194356830 /NCGR_PEP_ID=MMETSP0174-20130528/4399_1 /TAXON_ID=216777 /ORGANISM="Proboscia alata, Strain PI-D3" /LENGTH=328 /DNA_ID=CAMNT_0039126589 /DNA_START=59 /DNA_END=1045 /DNA_ORIENTATION=+
MTVRDVSLVCLSTVLLLNHITTLSRAYVLPSTLTFQHKSRGLLVVNQHLTTRRHTLQTQQHASPILKMSSPAAASMGAPTIKFPPGVTKTVLEQGNGPFINIGDVATVKYSCYLPNNPSAIPFAKSNAEKMIVGEGLMIDGWEFGLQSMRQGERSVIRVSDPRYGYGISGVSPLIPPNAEIEMDIQVSLVEAGVDLGTIASADPLKPRTPASIAAAYNTRREQAALDALNETDEGLDYWIKKIKGYYFFGFFEGETGEKPPWYLTPSITFPIAFAVVGAAFAVSLAGGAIKERGVQVTDELDAIIISSAAVQHGIMMAAAAVHTGISA